jgi:hypothetical protein
LKNRDATLQTAVAVFAGVNSQANALSRLVMYALLMVVPVSEAVVKANPGI